MPVRDHSSLPEPVYHCDRCTVTSVVVWMLPPLPPVEHSFSLHLPDACQCRSRYRFSNPPPPPPHYPSFSAGSARASGPTPCSCAPPSLWTQSALNDGMLATMIIVWIPAAQIIATYLPGKVCVFGEPVLHNAHDHGTTTHDETERTRAGLCLRNLLCSALRSGAECFRRRWEGQNENRCPWRCSAHPIWSCESDLTKPKE